MMVNRIRGRSIWLALSLAAATAWAQPLSPGKWLVDLARDYPLTPQAGISSVDAEITLLLMEAAARVEPDLAEAYRWQVDLLRVLGRQEQMRVALESYLQRAPQDLPASFAWMQSAFDFLHTADEHAEFCRAQLAKEGLPAAVSSLLNARLADYHWNRGEESQAGSLAETAVREDPHNIAARQVLLRMAPPQDRVPHNIGILLAQLEVNPADVDAARQLGDECTLYGLSAHAEIWYQHAQRLVERLSPPQSVAGLLLGRAAALVELNRLDEAEELVKRAIELESEVIDTIIMRAQVALLKGDLTAAEAHFKHAARLCKSTIANAAKARQGLDRTVVIQIGWILAHYVDALGEAERLTQLVLQSQPDEMIANRTVGAVQLRREQFQDARRTLAPLADQDLWSAIMLAETLKGLGKDDEAASRLRAATTQPANFEQRYRIRSLGKQWKVDFPATQPALKTADQLLTSFNPEIREYPFEPGRFLSLSLEVKHGDVLPGQPWWCEVRLRNSGSFPISIGPAMMIEPGLLTVIDARGDRSRSSGGSIRLMLDRRFQLMPGESMEVAQTLDVGAIRSGMIGTPQTSQDVHITTILNPQPVILADGSQGWQPGFGGIQLKPVFFRRLPLRVEGELLRRLFGRLQAEKPDERIEAMEQLAMLLAEHQHLAAGRLRYGARQIDAAVLQAAVLSRVDDPDWRVRARLAECMRWFVLDDSTMPTAMRLVNDSHWLVRSLARRLLADQHGDRFSKVLEATSRSDPDDWARRFARTLLDRERIPETAPGP
ncbi:MAG TPA: HEAT repeat domain-containing protein [Phycisphaerae bacterium]|nr:HEAT repeat domain-containing protein [Phycisphaerae bacterium]